VLPAATQPSANQLAAVQQSEVQSVMGLSNQVLDQDLRQRSNRLGEQIYRQQAAIPQPTAQGQREAPGQSSQGGDPQQDRTQQPSPSTKQPRSSGKTSWISPDQQALMNTQDAQARGENYDFNGQMIVTNSGNSMMLRGGVKEGSARSLWIGDTLVLARRAKVNGNEYIQGCRLDWPGLHSWLLGEIRDLLPEATLEPANLSRTRTTRDVSPPYRSALSPEALPPPPRRPCRPFE